MCVRLTDRALCLTEFASGETICLKQRAPETALYCASGRSSLQFATPSEQIGGTRTRPWKEKAGVASARRSPPLPGQRLASARQRGVDR